jgi:F420-dependent oxidoreductase-like protein
MRLGTSVIQLSARTPTACAMAALTLDHLSGGRHILGLGVSGPQVVEGWYGQKFPKPLARTREYVDILRQVWARDAPVHSAGPHYPLPLTGEGTTGLGKNLKPITHPLRADIPIMLGAEGPKNVALAAEICDGWLPIFYSPRIADMYNEWLDEGFARPGARRTRETFEICATAQVVITDDRPAIMELMKPHLALYMGGMGAEDTNFHADVYRRMGYADVVAEVTELFRTDRKDEAAKVIPDELVDDSAIVGNLDYVREQIKVWEAAGVTMMVIGARSTEQIRELAGLV